MTAHFEILTGTTDPLGLSIQGDIANFSLFSSHATNVILGLFWDKMSKEIPMNRTKDIWHVAIKNPPQNSTYAFKCEGPPELLYNPNVWLADPYAKMPADIIRTKVALPPPFNWENTKPPKIPTQDLIIYEMHIRGFTKHPSSKVSHPGTYLGMIEKIPYLKKLGINAVEFLPIFEFDETYLHKPPHINYWGYNSTHFFAPKKTYAATSDPATEFKTLVKELHKNGIEVILDVVYNHTGEGKIKDYYVNFRGIDNSVYYQMDEENNYRDFACCGNTVNTAHPVVMQFILDSLRYWTEEMHVDGFRFDLAAIFTRDLQGNPIGKSPLIEAIGQDPILSKVKLIAEPWDAAGLYLLGHFPQWGPWSEWNGRYRDVVRKFIKGTDGKAGAFANVICGSEFIYCSSGSPLSSINFVTAHDGYSLHDLVSYQEKHNWDNGENNQDGSNQNDSWNCGAEGPTNDPQINALRERQMRNFLLALLLSQGIPMILMGDEYGHTRKGNNNPYVQDNEINWFLWNQKNPKMVNFVAALIAFRKEHPQLKSKQFLKREDIHWETSWSDTSRTVIYTLPGIHIAFNADYVSVNHTLPPGDWKLVVNTGDGWDFHDDGPVIQTVELLPYSALIAKKT